jgi:hypothetical protein
MHQSLKLAARAGQRDGRLASRRLSEANVIARSLNGAFELFGFF